MNTDTAPAFEFVLYRILGNDLPPRHAAGQTLANLRFILAHEPELAGCDKRWVLNRIVDAELERACLELIQAAGHHCIRIPFEADVYARRLLDGCDMPPQPAEPPPRLQLWAEEWRYRYKTLYVADVNGARNRALAEGRGVARWVLPWDGACFMTAAAWDQLLSLSRRHETALQLIVPLARVADNRLLLSPSFDPENFDEPQIAFRCDSTARFDPSRRYGNFNKAELLVRLGVPGPWQQWVCAPWDATPTVASPEAGRHATGAWVARLASGSDPAIDVDSASRWGARFEGVHRLCDRLDQGRVAARMQAAPTLCYPVQAVPERHGALLLQRAEAALQRPLPSLLQKTSLPPSGDPRDYFSLSPYHHAAADGAVQYLDGQRHDAATLSTDAGKAYDRIALERLCQDGCAAALAGRLTGERRFFDYTASLLQGWFIDPASRMNPHIGFAQTVAGRGAGQLAGVVEFRRLWCLLDAVLLCRQAQVLSDESLRLIRLWFAEFLGDLERRGVERQLNNLGTWADLTMAAATAFIGDSARASRILGRAPLRLAQQLAPFSVPQLELRRATPLHYALFQLEAWINLAWLGRGLGVDLWAYSGASHRSLAMAMRFVALNRELFAEYAAAAASFDQRIAMAIACVPADAADFRSIETLIAGNRLPIFDAPEFGLPPLWPGLGAPAATWRARAG